MAIDYQQLANGMNFLSSLNNPYSYKKDILTVNGFQEAKDYKLNRGERVILMDANENIIYVKECSDIGKYDLKIFECNEVTEKYSTMQTQTNITREEFNQLSENVNKMMEMLKEKNNGKHDV